MSKTNKNWVLPLVLGPMLLLAACGTTDNDEVDTPSMDQEISSSQEMSSTQEMISSQESSVSEDKTMNKDTVIDGIKYNDAKVTVEEAFNTFMDSHTGAKVTELKLDTKDDVLEYKVEGYDENNEYQMRINATTKETLKDDTKNLDEEDKNDGTISKDDVSKIKDSIDKAMKETDDTMRFKQWSIEDNDGKLEFEVEFKDTNDKDVEYTYDVRSGDLIEKGD